MCGASLEAAAAAPADEKTAPRRRPRWLFWLGTIALALVLLVIIGFLVQPLIFPSAPAFTPTPSRPTPTPTPTVVLTPTETPTPTPTPTPIPPRAHQVRQGETLSTIALQYDTTIEDILALNPGLDPQLIQTGQVLLIPPAEGAVSTAEAGPTATPASFVIHVVAPGETLLSIAERYGVTVALIRAANPELPAGSDVIRVNQSLVIPIGTPTPTPVPTVDVNVTPTPRPLYAPPALLSPPNGAIFGGPDAVIVLQWASVGILGPGEWYAVHVERSGIPPLIVRTRATAYRLPAELYPPPDALSRELRWHVQVVRRVSGGTTDELVSLPEAVRTLLWLETAPTPTATPFP